MRTGLQVSPRAGEPVTVNYGAGEVCCLPGRHAHECLEEKGEERERVGDGGGLGQEGRGGRAADTAEILSHPCGPGSTSE